jgi:undecaprenyl-diphosphatase
MKSKIHAFDRAVYKSVVTLPHWFRPIMLGFTWLGEPPITVGIAAVVLGYGLALNKPYYIIAGAIAIGTIAIGGLLKIFLRRARPVNEYVEKMFFKTFSFPSGHATGAVVSFGLAALIIATKWPELAAISWTAALISMIFVSISRIYLGAHFASDIIGGWIVGVVGLAAIFLIN